MKEGKLIIFSAPSGAGKTTLVKYLLSKNLNLAFSISATTRARRGEEIDGKDYYFLSREDFENKIAHEEFVEFEEVYAGTYYGTLKKEVERIWEEGKHVIFDVDVVGGLNLKKQYGDAALSVFVKPPSVDALRDRLTKRGTDTTDSVMKRLAKATSEIHFASEFDKVVLNDTLEHACAEAEKIVTEFLEH